jgi:predicted esterase
VSEEFFVAKYDQPQIEDSVNIIMKLIEQEMKLVGGDPRRIFLGGFSQGACIALTTYLAFKGG